MADRIKFNHRRRIVGKQPTMHKGILPGMIIHFKYEQKNVFDPLPLVLVLWNDVRESKIHGINLNYLTEVNIKRMFKQVLKYGSTMPEKQPKVTEQDQDDNKSDDNLPNRNLLKEPYTRLKLPTFREIRDGQPISKAQAMTEMKMLYASVFKRFVKQHDMYRSYLYTNMSTMRVVRYDIEGL